MTGPLVTRDDVCAAIELWQARHGEGSVVTRAFVADVRSGVDMTRWKNDDTTQL